MEVSVNNNEVSVSPMSDEQTRKGYDHCFVSIYETNRSIASIEQGKH